ncbi:hypothetical protein ORE89_001761 [Escherichia coli]|nr:hypothetical protein [Escherichia coli]EKD3542980.1 hypothetical protein [Escherichia coli]EKP6465209.1 hypothetical protein [Escherichia coli]MCN2291665.1 hypothetical protein [Escherichia coli]
MESNIKGLVAAGHEMASELKAECGAVDMRSVAKLISDLATQLEVQLVRANALAAENAGLKHAMAVTLEHVSVTDAGQAGVAAMIINDALHHSETPATDAFLAEVRAQGVEMLAKNHQSIVNALKGDSLFSDGEYRHAAIVSAAVYFAAELRKGGCQ